MDSVISGNSARTGDPTPIHQARGGGISSYGGGAIVITNSVVTNNFAGCDTSTTACLDALGGGIDADTTHLTISSSIISENTASATVAAYGGGIFNYVQTVAGTDAQISDTAISGNSANAGSSYQGKGGGLFTMDGIPAYSGPTLISGSTISGNSASGGGGGIYAHIDTLSVVNSTVSANSAGFTGGGIYLGHGEGYYYSEPMMVRNCTITANISNGSYGGGGVVDAHPHNGPSTFESTIIAGNIATAASPVYDADLGVRLGTIIGANNLIVAANGVTLPPDTISADPLLGPLQDNGGPTWTHALLPGSPAIDAGSNPENLVWDQRGNGHPRVVGISADIGAFEYFDGVDQAPMAEDDSYTTAENTMLKVAAPGMLGNDSDPDGDTLTAILVGNPSNGALTLNADGSFVYVPVAGFSGTDSFTYEANDGQLNSNVATVTIKVSHVDQPPVAANDSYTAAQNMTLKVSAPGVLGNDSDPDGDTLSAVLVSAPSNGTLAMNPDGSFIYVPAAGFSGSDSFTYAANDGQVDSNIATVTIKVAQFDQPPVAAKDSFTADENSTLKVSAPGVLGNDSDPDGDTLTALLIGTPSNGTLAMNPDGSFIYVPAVGFFGTDSFTYEASDGQLDSNVATVTITITPNSDDAIFSDGFDGP